MKVEYAKSEIIKNMFAGFVSDLVKFFVRLDLLDSFLKLYSATIGQLPLA
jgi:hypothetical protein